MDGPEFCSPPKRNILGNLNQNGGSPVSPMANLKLLTKVATSHFSMGENKEYEEVQLRKNNLKGDSKPSRRFRSLSFICKKFLQLYKLDIPIGDSQQISLGNLALSLGIEKRRVYDIINVVSSLHMAVKVCKDKYNWYGNQNLLRLLSQLKAFALINKFDEQINTLLQNQILYSSTIQESESPYIKITRGDRSVFEENRIGVLCQKFIMLFLVSSNDVPLNMCTISKLILTGDMQDKTGMRRLYDIANVLEALDLIERYHCKIMKKPSFKYCGPAVNIDHSDCGRLIVNQSHEISEQGDTNSDSSLDCIHGNNSKLNSILEVVCTEFEEEISKTSPIPIKRKYCGTDDLGAVQCNAKKQLFPPPYVLSSVDSANTFIRAPKHSFRLEYNKLQVKDPAEANNNVDVSLSDVATIQTRTLSLIDHQPSNFSVNAEKLEQIHETFPNKLNFETFTDSKNSLKISNDETDFQNKTLVFSNLSNSTYQPIVPSKIKVLRPMKISDIQNGGVYKVLKKGNTVQLYAI